MSSTIFKSDSTISREPDSQETMTIFPFWYPCSFQSAAQAWAQTKAPQTLVSKHASKSSLLASNAGFWFALPALHTIPPTGPRSSYTCLTILCMASWSEVSAW